ncbi:MAG: S8 family serine peptidase [Candidatus Njordarchaeia archaeon]
MNTHRISSIILIALFLIVPIATISNIQADNSADNSTTLISAKPVDKTAKKMVETVKDNLIYPKAASITQQLDEGKNKKLPTELALEQVEAIESSEIRDLLIRDVYGRINVLVVLNLKDGSINALKSLGETKWIAAIGGGKVLASCYIKEEDLPKLYQVPGVVKGSPNFYLFNKNMEKINDYKYKMDFITVNRIYDDALLDRRAAEILNAVPSWEAGYNGSGITIAVVDTGVDFAAKPLENKFVIQGNNVLGFVPDGDSVALTPYILHPYTENGKSYLPTKNRTFEFYDPFFNEYYTITLERDYNVTGITSKSNNYHLGFIIEWIPGGGYIYGFVTPVLVTDSNTAGVYDTVWVDITFSLYNYATIFGLPIDEKWKNYTFEGPYTIDANNKTKALVAIDVYNTTIYPNGTVKTELGKDGYYDYSLGVIGVPFIDTTGGVSRFLASVGLGEKFYYNGLDPNGYWVGFMYDFYGHGTSVATTAAGAETVYKVFYENDTTIRNLTVVGLAPEAKIFPIRALSWGHIIEGWLYATGFDLDVSSSLGTQIWTYIGNHKAQIISNSWGESRIWAEYGNKMYSTDIVSLMETILSLKGSYLTPKTYGDTTTEIIYNITNIASYTPSLFIHAAGNGGPGYGTANVNPYSPLAIQVGASTSNHWRPVYTNETEGTSDHVIWWSGKGPIVSGFGSPDVLAIGAYAFEAEPPAIAGGGSIAVSLFGGTSQATPIVAGAAAIVLQAFNSTNGSWSPLIIKSLLMAGCDNVGYDVFSMGAGRVNVNKSVSLALNKTVGDLVYIYDGFVADFLNNVLGLSAPFSYIDVGYPYIDAGFVFPGETKNLTLKPYQFLGDNDSISSVSGYRLELVDASKLFIDLDPAKSNFTSQSGYYYMFDLGSLGVDLSKYDFARFTTFMTKGEYDASGISYMGLWGYNGGTVDDQSDVYLINRFTGYGNIFTVDLSTLNLPSNVLLGFYSTGLNPVKVKVFIQLYKKTALQNLSFGFSGDHNNIDITLTISSNAKPGTYWGYINITTSDNGNQLIPLVYHVVMSVETGKSYTYTGTYAQPNDSTVLKQSGMLDKLDSKNIEIEFEAGKIYRVTLQFLGVSTSPSLVVLDENQTVIAQGYEAGPTEISTWFEAETTGNYTIKITNNDETNTLHYTLSIIMEQSTYSIGDDNSTYPNYSFVGGYDWSWRAEVGEWRFFYLETNDTSLINVTVEWENYASDAYIHVFHYNTGYILAKQTPNYIGRGVFEDIWLNSTSIAFPAKPNELYVIAIRAPVLSGVSFPENYKVLLNVIKYSGPYITLSLSNNIVPYLSTLKFEAEIKSSAKLMNVTYEIDGLQVKPISETISVQSENYWIVTGEVEVHSIAEGMHNFTIRAFDSYTSNPSTKRFYVDSSSPILTGIIVNGTAYSGEPVGLTGDNKGIYISFKVEDATPKNISFSLFNNYNRSLYETGMLQFNIEQGGFEKLMNITSGKATYNQKSGRWEIEFNLTISPNLLEEGYYLLNMEAFDQLNNNMTIVEMPIFYVDVSAPKITKFTMYEGEPPKTLLAKEASLTTNKANYTLKLEGGETYNVYLSWDNPSTDLDLYIYDPYGYYAAMSINYGYVPENVTFTAKIGGNYTIQIVKYVGPNTNYYITVREVREQEKIGAVGPNMDKLTLDFTIFEVNLKNVEVAINKHKFSLNLNQANYTHLGYTRYIIVVNASLFNEITNNITIKGVDASLREGITTYQILRDASPPNLNIYYDEYTREPVNLSIVTWDNETGIKEVRVYVDGAEYAVLNGPIKGNYTSIIINTTSMSEGKHYIVVSSVDQALNVVNKTGVFYLDYTPPEVSIIGYANNTEIGENTVIMLNIQDNAKASAIRLYLNDTLYRVILVTEGNTLYQTAIDLREYQGDHVLIQLLAFDQAGNTRSVKYVFSIDRNPPEIQITAPEATMIKDFNISITVIDDNFMMAYIYINNSLVKILTGNITTTTINIKVSEYADGTHTIRVVAMDKAGNTAAEEKQFKTGYYQEKVYRERTQAIWIATAALLGGIGIGVVAYIVVQRMQKKRKEV